MGPEEQPASPINTCRTSQGVGFKRSYASTLSVASGIEELPICSSDRGGGGYTGLSAHARELRPAGWPSSETIGVLRGNTSRKSNNKKKKSQARRDRWKAQAQLAELKKKYRAFNKGTQKFTKKLHCTHEELSAALVRGPLDKHSSKLFSTSEVKFAGIHGDSKECGSDSREMQRMIEFLGDGGVGYMPERKRRGWIRLMFENWNSLGLYTQDWKVDRINYLIKNLSIDVIAGCESQVDWSFVEESKQFLNLFRYGGRAAKGAYSHNSDPDSRFGREQIGGTGIAALGRLCDNVTDSGVDPTGLGRYSWIKLGSGRRTTVVISGYLATKPDLKKSRGKTRWEQEQRYFVKRGDLRDPTQIFIADILGAIRSWRSAGLQVVLVLDANQDVYDGQLAMALQQAPYHMGCLMEEAMGCRVPNSHSRGKKPLTTFFGTSGLTVGNGMVYPHAYGVGDHRVYVLELSSESVFGGVSHPIPPASTRSLNCKISRVRQKYCKVLRALTDRHKMFDKLRRLEALDKSVSVAQYQLMHNKWDNELGEFMASAESQCNRFKSCSIEYSPHVGHWIKRRAILKWLLRWHDGKVPDPRNLVRAATRNEIGNPLELTRDVVEARLVECIGELFRLKKDAPELRRQHLKWCLLLAKERGDELAVQEILRIIRREAQSRRQNNINRFTKAGRGRSVLQVQVQTPDGLKLYTSRKDVHHQCGTKLVERFGLGRRAPISTGAMADALGNLSDTEAAQQILDDNFIFPTDCDQATIDLLREASRVKLEFDKLPPASMDTTIEDFVGFWSTCREKTASSKSNRHFAHYRASCDDIELVKLHVGSVNLAARQGAPLQRWRCGVTVLLEKVLGNVLIDKLRAICLLEADFNWWLKVIFAKRMIVRMKECDVLPIEHGAVKGKTCNDTTMLKQLFYDQANILHETCAVTSTDAAQCYDAVNHPMASIFLQAMGVALNLVLTYFVCLQTMQYFLKTGFGTARKGFGGILLLPLMGLIQGSGAAPATWTAVSTVIVRSYKRKGYGAFFSSGWSGLLFTVAALLYVDDTDLLHRFCDPNITELEFVQRVQRATYYWAMLLQATGGHLKDTKCYWYLLSYKFVRGVATLRSLREHSKYQLVIPQPLGEDVEIELRDPDVPSEVLGVYSCPSGIGKKQLSKMVDKGKKWAGKVRGSSLSPSDVWFSFSNQSVPSFSFGLCPLMSSPEEVEREFMAMYYQCLSPLGVNQCITKEWRILPVEWSGLGMPNMSLEKLSCMIMFLKQHWGFDDEFGRALRCVFELVQIETGLAGNFLLRHYDTFECLASHTWYKLLWKYLWRYDVKLELEGQLCIPEIRERDRTVMEEVLRFLPKEEWVAFNRVRKQKEVYHFSHLVMCDGATVDPALLTKRERRLSLMRFPREQPLPADFKVWERTIKTLTSPRLILSPPLGKFLRRPTDKIVYRSNATNDFVISSDEDNNHVLYSPRLTGVATRTSSLFVSTGPITDLPPLTHYVSVRQHAFGSISVHSSSIIHAVKVDSVPSLLEALQEYDSPTLWQTLNLGDDENWVKEAIAQGSLLPVHDGSFMIELCADVCAAALVILCVRTGRMATVTVVERTDARTASNYRGELLGGLLLALLLRAATLDPTLEYKPVEAWCDNLGVVGHGNDCHRSLPEKQSQADLVCTFRQILARLPMTVIYRHVYGHLDEDCPFDDLTISEQLNILADALAKEALKRAVAANRFISSNFPLENVRVFVDGTKVTASIKAALYASWGSRAARALYQEKNIVSTFNFDLIYHEGRSLAIRSYPAMFRVYLTKRSSGFDATNRHLSRSNPGVANICPCCLHKDESTAHITRCTDKGRVRMFRESTDQLIDWLGATDMDSDLVACISRYLDSRGEGSMLELTSGHDSLSGFAMDHDTLGWDNFLEGRVSRKLVELQVEYISQAQSRWRPQTWCKFFIQHLLNITHRQWLYRNAKIHLRKLEGKTASEHNAVIAEVRQMMLIDPEELLPQHRSLLERDFRALGEGSTVDRQIWLAQMKSALGAAEVLGSKRKDSVMAPQQEGVGGRVRTVAGLGLTKQSNLAKRARL